MAWCRPGWTHSAHQRRPRAHARGKNRTNEDRNDTYGRAGSRRCRASRRVPGCPLRERRYCRACRRLLVARDDGRQAELPPVHDRSTEPTVVEVLRSEERRVGKRGEEERGRVTEKK